MRLSVSTNNTDFKPVEVTEDSIAGVLLQEGNWSPATYKNNYRIKKNFEQASVIALDFDGGFSLSEAKEAFKNYKHVIGTTRSHQIEKDGVIDDRFRVVLFLSEQITDPKVYTGTVRSLLKKYPDADKACSDASRMFYHCKEIVSENDGARITPVAVVEREEKVIDIKVEGKGRLAYDTSQFLLFGTDKNWNNRLFKAAIDLHEQGYTKTEAAELLNLATRDFDGALDENDLKTIQSAYERDPEHPPRANAGVEEFAFEFKTIKQLYEEKPSINWLVDGLLTVGGLSIIAGQAKAGKSTIVRQLCTNIARGEAFLERRVKQGQVVYLALEEQEALIYDQFKAMGLKDEDPILYHVGPILKQEFYNDFEEFVMQSRPNFIVIDTFVLFSRIKDQNNYQEVYNALTRLRNLARKSESHIMVIHHQNKGDNRGLVSVMGSSAFTGAVDCIVCFDSINQERFINAQGRGVRNFITKPLEYNKSTQQYALGANNDEF